MSDVVSNAEVESAFPAFNLQKRCRHGLMLYNTHDAFVGRSLDLYSEFSQGEIGLFEQFIRAGQTVVEVGANIGSHTIWLAQAVGASGTIFAFEPQRVVFQTLCANLALNSITNVRCVHAAAGRRFGHIVVPALDYARPNNFGGIELGRADHGEKVPVVPIDSLDLSACHLLKIDVEGMEKEVLEGAVGCIKAHWPALYVENDREEKAEALIRFIDSLGYYMYWHRPPLYNPANFAGNPTNVFGRIVSVNMICLPKWATQDVNGFEPVRVPPADAER